MASHEDLTSAVGPRIVGPAKASTFSATPTISQPPTVYHQPARPAAAAAPPASFTTALAPSASGFRPAGRTIVPPSMTLDESDVNGFKGTAQGKKANRNNKKRSTKSNKREDPSLSYHPSVVYEVGKPCDYALYKTYVNQQRIQRRLELEEERRRARESDGSSYFSEDDDLSDHDTQNANKKARLYAPPTSYDTAPTSGLGAAPFFNPATVPAASTPAFTPATATPNAAAAVREETGEEAYARRLALSRGAPPPTAPQLPPPQPSYPAFSAASSSQTAFSTPTGTFVAASATQPPPPPPPPSTFRPPPGLGRPTSADFFAAGSPTPPPPPPPGFNPPPGFRPVADAAPTGESAYGAGPSFVSSASVAGAGPAPGSAVSDAAAKAREIAARLSKLSGMSMPLLPPLVDTEPLPPASGSISASASPAPVQTAEPAEPDTRSFAERHMAKLGWSVGKGLGASESGMTAALSVQSASSGQPSKKALARHKAAGTAPPPLPTGLAGRATVIDSSRAERERAQIDKHGEPSRVVVLTNMVGPAEVDDDLGGEVAEEANRFGVVERCFVHVVPGERREDEAVRIFLVMSGLAGGYNAVKQFEGRFFGGRTVRARFYQEDDLKRGNYTA